MGWIGTYGVNWDKRQEYISCLMRHCSQMSQLSPCVPIYPSWQFVPIHPSCPNTPQLSQYTLVDSTALTDCWDILCSRVTTTNNTTTSFTCFKIQWIKKQVRDEQQCVPLGRRRWCRGGGGGGGGGRSGGVKRKGGMIRYDYQTPFSQIYCFKKVVMDVPTDQWPTKEHTLL